MLSLFFFFNMHGAAVVFGYSELLHLKCIQFLIMLE